MPPDLVNADLAADPRRAGFRAACWTPLEFNTIAVGVRRLEVDLSGHELRDRAAARVAPLPTVTSGVLAKYARGVGSAAQGAVTR